MKVFPPGGRHLYADMGRARHVVLVVFHTGRATLVPIGAERAGDRIVLFQVSKKCRQIVNYPLLVCFQFHGRTLYNSRIALIM